MILAVILVFFKFVEAVVVEHQGLVGVLALEDEEEAEAAREEQFGGQGHCVGLLGVGLAKEFAEFFSLVLAGVLVFLEAKKRQQVLRLLLIVTGVVPQKRQ